jgi:hypothetical protein
MCRIWMTFFAALATLGLSMRVSNAQSDPPPSTPGPQNGEVGSGLPNKLDGRTMRTPTDLDRPGLDSKQSDKAIAEDKKSAEESEKPENSDYRSEEEYKAAGKDTVARKLEYGERPIDNTRAFLRSQTPFVQPGQWQFDFGATYSVFESDLPFISGATLTEVNAKRRRLDAPVGFRYGMTERLQLFGSTAVGWQGTEVSDGFTEQTRNTNGIGDILTGFNYLLRKETKDCPAIIGSCDVVIPTGNAVDPRQLLDSGLGLGAWSLSSRFLMVKSLDPIVAFWGAGYRLNFEDTYNGNRVDIGDQIQYTFGIGFGVNDKVTLSSALIGSYITDFKVNSVTVPGSSADLISLRMASTFSNCRGITEPFVSFGLTEQTPAATVGIVWTR